MTREKLTPDNPEYYDFYDTVTNMAAQLRDEGHFTESDVRTLHRLLGQHLWAIESERRQARVTHANGG